MTGELPGNVLLFFLVHFLEVLSREVRPLRGKVLSSGEISLSFLCRPFKELCNTAGKETESEMTRQRGPRVNPKALQHLSWKSCPLGTGPEGHLRALLEADGSRPEGPGST